MTSAAAALAKAKTVTRWTMGMCDNFVANMYGYSSSGYATAQANWNATPANLKHAGDMNAPAGALMYWGGGDGHVAISLGNGSIISTDIGGNGTVTTAPASAINTKWGKPYLGWTYPFFNGKEATNTLGAWSGSTTATNASLLSSVINPDSIAKGFVSGMLGPIESLLSSLLWGVEILSGIALLTAGVLLILGKAEL